MAYTLAQVLLVPLAAIPITFVSGRKFGKRTGWVVAMPLIYTLLLLLSAAYRIRNGGAVTDTARDGIVDADFLAVTQTVTIGVEYQVVQ